MHKTRHLTFLASTSKIFLPCLEHTVQVSLQVLYSNKINSTFSVNSHSIVFANKFFELHFKLLWRYFYSSMYKNSKHAGSKPRMISLPTYISSFHLIDSFVSDYRLGHFTVISLPSQLGGFMSRLLQSFMLECSMGVWREQAPRLTVSSSWYRVVELGQLLSIEMESCRYRKANNGIQ